VPGGKRKLSLVVVPAALLLLPAGGRLFAAAEGGAHIPVQIETPADYAGVPVAGEVACRWSHVLSHPGATYIAVHFVGFDLAPEDYLVVSSATGDQQYELSGRGKMQAGTFWARHIKGDTVVLELIVTSPTGGKGFDIDEYVAGWPRMAKSVYPPDDRENAVCYRDSHPEEYDRGRAVVRLLTNGSAFCTGSLVSPYGHILTNNHCIFTPERALNTDFEFMAEAPECDTPNCPNCHPGVVFSGGTLIAQDPWLDYSLILLSEGDPASQFGYLEFDNRPAILRERIYVPQHSAGEAKEFAIYSSHPSDTGGVARIQSVTEDPCIAGSHLEVGYYADTQPGSSGSPVLATSSHKIIALNHCQGDINMGVPVDLFFDELENHILGLTLPGRIAAGSIAVTADSYVAGQEPADAIDMDIHTLWMSGASGGSHSLQLDLGLEAPVIGFRVWHAGAAGYSPSFNTKQFVIQSAPDPDGPWSDEFVGSNPQQANVTSFEYAAPRALRHVRLLITDPGDTTYARIPEFEVIAGETIVEALPNGPNVAPLAVTAQASSVFGPEWGADKAIDQVVSLESKWCSADLSPPHTLTIDLGDHHPVAGFILRQPSAAGEADHFNATEFSFQSARSLSGPWFTESHVFTAGDSDYVARAFVSPKDLRYVRLHIADPGIDRYARVPEFEVRMADLSAVVRPSAGTLVFQDGREYPDGALYAGTRDAHIIESHPLSNTGTHDILEACRVQGTDAADDRSVVIRFGDLDTSWEADKYLREATLTLDYCGSRGDPTGVSKTLHCHKLLIDWGEGAQTGIDGALAAAGECSWARPWGAQGEPPPNPSWDGTLDPQFADPVALDSVTLGGPEDYGPVTFDVTAAVWEHLRDPAQDFGFVIREEQGSEDIADGTRQFHSREYTERTLRPSLTLRLVEPVRAPAGTHQVGWNLTSIPVDPYLPEAGAVFLDLLDAGNPIENSLFRYDPGVGYAAYPGAFTDVRRGQGYWLWLTNGAGPTGIGVAGAEATADVAISLLQGWNLIGHPFPAAQLLANCQVKNGAVTKNFDQAVVAGWIAAVLYRWEPHGGYRTLRTDPLGHDDSLRAWYGYWVYALAPDLQLIVPVP